MTAASPSAPTPGAAPPCENASVAIAAASAPPGLAFRASSVPHAHDEGGHQGLHDRAVYAYVVRGHETPAKPCAIAGNPPHTQSGRISPLACGLLTKARLPHADAECFE